MRVELAAVVELLGVLLAVLPQVLSDAVEKFGKDECFALGYSPNLMCNSCKDLDRFDLGLLKPSCVRCCKEETDVAGGGKKLYRQAILEVCGWKLPHYPQLEAFIKSDLPNQYPGLSIRYARGAEPIVKLLSDSGDEVETLAINRWDTDTVVEFFDSHVERVGSHVPTETASDSAAQQDL